MFKLLGGGLITNSFYPFKSLLANSADTSLVDQNKQNLLTGFPSIDKITGGFRPGELIFISGRPAMGKSSVALNIAHHAALKENKTVVYFTYEMLSEEVSMRLMSIDSRVDLLKLRTSNLTNSDLKAIANSTRNLSSSSIYINDLSETTSTDICRECQKIDEKEGIDLIVIDYLQLIPPTNRKNNRGDEHMEIIDDLKKIAIILKCPIIITSQMQRYATSGAPLFKPTTPDFYSTRSLDSKSIYSKSDYVILLHRDAYYDVNALDDTLEVIMAKTRSGFEYTTKIKWNEVLGRC
jgi:replicative DNA helicase